MHHRASTLLAASLLLVGLSACSSDTTSTASSTSRASNAPTDASTTTATTVAPTASALPNGRFHAVRIAHGLDSPVAVATRPGDDALYVAEQYRADVLALRGSTRSSARVVLDLAGAVTTGNEQGLLGIAFSPDGSRLAIDFTAPDDGATHVDEYTMLPDGTADPASVRHLLRVAQPFPNHNGGHVVYDSRGLLYIGFGDGGAGNDPYGNGQNPRTLLGKILRIDPSTSSNGHDYGIPADNPFADGAQGAPEIWALGVRNPWRFSIDATTGDVWIGDVGQNEWEEIDRVPAGRNGANLGWNRREGTHEFQGGDRHPDDLEPVHDYPHGDDGCSVTGGLVHRGERVPALQGVYVYSDFCSGELSALVLGADGAAQVAKLGVHIDQPAAFADAPRGDLVVVSRAGDVFRITGG